MISFLDGVLRSKSPTEVVVDVNGVGYAVSIPLSTFEKLDGVDGRTRLFTHLHVREDSMQLFGFSAESERELFRLLISISGIGPKIALGILSGMAVAEIKHCIIKGDVAALTALQGVGRKTAERIIIELREKLARFDDTSGIGSGDMSVLPLRTEAIDALLSLGYNRPQAEAALRAVIKEAGGANLSLEALIKSALRHSAR